MRHSRLPESPTIARLKYSQTLHWQLLSRLVIGMSMAFALIIIVVVLVISSNEETSWRDRQAEAARNATVIIDGFMQRVRDSLALASQISSASTEFESQAIHLILTQNPALFEIVRVDAQATQLTSAQVDGPILADRQVIPQSAWFQAAQSGQVYLGGVEISASNEPYITVALPDAGQGIVAGRLSMAALWDVVNSVRFGKTGIVYIADGQGNIIAHSDPQVIYEQTTLAGRPEFKAASAAQDFRWSGAYTDFAGVKVLGISSPVQGTPWIIFTELTDSEAHSLSRTNTLLIQSGFVLLLALVIITSWVFLRRVVYEPIHTLQAGVEKLGQGELQHRIPVARFDEIGLVAIAVNRMSSRLFQREHELMNARDQALVASRVKSEILSRVSHELRTPLNAILGYAEMLKEQYYGPLNEKQEKAAGEIQISTRYLTNLVNDLLEQARLEAGRLKLNIRAFEPRVVVQDVYGVMKVLADEKGLELTAETAPDVPARLRSDVLRIRQIIVNLVGNAIKFTDQGFVRIRVYLPAPDQWAIEVQDSGPGIPEEAHGIIFEAFRQVDGSSSRVHQGAGLGLSIVKQLTELMGGQVLLQSKVGEGSTFTIQLPMEAMEEAKT